MLDANTLSHFEKPSTQVFCLQREDINDFTDRMAPKRLYLRHAKVSRLKNIKVNGKNPTNFSTCFYVILVLIVSVVIIYLLFYFFHVLNFFNVIFGATLYLNYMLITIK